ncbi:MAG TPA: nucleotidyl transferase AbiEii/AbiGii toxin family protein [Puia sp.]
MVEFLQLPENQRRQIIEQVNSRTAMSLKAVEKDWWVTLVLKALFSLPMRQHFIFKGGTSLSKAWKLIERFSEDIDIALAPEAFGRDYRKAPSNSYVKTLKKEGCAYTTNIIKDALQEQLAAMGVPAGLITIDAEEVNPIMPDKDPQTLFARYPSLYDPNLYIAEAVKVEFGVRSLKEPFAEVPIQSIIAEVFPNPSYSETPFLVTAVEPRKTFMEKLFLLHEKFSIVREDVLVQERQSRHLSDLGSMTRQGIAQQVIDDQNLYDVLLEHRRHYVRLKNVDYEGMHIAGLRIIPPPALMGQFRQDYETMLTEMIYGDAPDFDTLIDQLTELNGLLIKNGQQGK